MKIFFFVLFILFLPLICLSQTADTLYVDEVDTVVVKQEPLILNKTVYHEITSKVKNKKTFSFSPSVGVLWDFSNYEICKTCQEEFNKIRSASSYTSSIQYNLLISFFYKRVSLGVEASYRISSKNINYSSDTLQFNSNLKVTYIMVGPSVGYKMMQRKRWDIDLYAGVLFSYTTNQLGKTIGGEGINKLIDIHHSAFISSNNFLYHLAPTLLFKANDAFGISLAAHYYFDNNSNLTKNQSYTEQRNSLGFSIGIKYSL